MVLPLHEHTDEHAWYVFPAPALPRAEVNWAPGGIASLANAVAVH